jgi:hypothetical protein
VVNLSQGLQASGNSARLGKLTSAAVVFLAQDIASKFVYSVLKVYFFVVSFI